MTTATPLALWLDRSDRDRLELTGPDRAKFLHNLTTNDVKRLAVGRGHESFVTSPQGKTLGYISVLAADDRLVVRTDPGGFGLVLPHFRKYGVFDDVVIEEVGPETFEAHLAGEQADSLLGSLGAGLPETGDLNHREGKLGGASVRLVRESPLGMPGLTVLGRRADFEGVAAELRRAGETFGLAELTPEQAERLRIEAGTPAFGRDVTADNLPQEVGRDDRAINFVKGCYLGQETVARLDALGHVNKILRGLDFEEGAAVPAGGSELRSEGKKVGTLTSAAVGSTGRVVALAYVRTTHAAPGTEVRVAFDGGEARATVAALPTCGA